MTDQADPVATLETAPKVIAIDGDVVLNGRWVSAAYTPGAARALALKLLEAANEADRQQPGVDQD